jgi:hypothetical protein
VFPTLPDNLRFSIYTGNESYDQGNSERAENEDDDEERDKDKEQDFCNRSRTSRDACEAQRACDERYYQENDSPLKHNRLP